MRFKMLTPVHVLGGAPLQQIQNDPGCCKNATFFFAGPFLSRNRPKNGAQTCASVAFERFSPFPS